MRDDAMTACELADEVLGGGNTMSCCVGIDPGTTGWVVAVDSDGIAWDSKMPASPGGLRDLLRDHTDCRVIVEEQSMRHGQAHQSMILVNYGRILGILLTLDIAHEAVRPQDWQKAMLRGGPKAKGATLKRQYVEVAERLWPRVQFRGPKGGLWDGKAAAALMALYGVRRIGGTP